MTIIYYEEVEKVRGPPEVEFRSYKVSSKKEAISKITDEYFSKNSLNIVVANSSITGPLIGMELLVNIEKFIIILDQINEELHRQWLLAAENFLRKFYLQILIILIPTTVREIIPETNPQLLKLCLMY